MILDWNILWVENLFFSQNNIATTDLPDHTKCPYHILASQS